MLGAQPSALCRERMALKRSDRLGGFQRLKLGREQRIVRFEHRRRTGQRIDRVRLILERLHGGEEIFVREKPLAQRSNEQFLGDHSCGVSLLVLQ